MTNNMTHTITRRGVMLVLSSPSGAGKTSIARRILRDDHHISLSISVTTRPPRIGEQHGLDYYFISEAEFIAMRDNDDLLESAKVFDYYYGTPKSHVLDMLDKGRDILFDIDWQGAQIMSQSHENDMVKIFILPPSHDELHKRLTNRNQDSADIVNRRMEKATDEIRHYSEYDWVIINKDFDEAVAQVTTILASERLRRRRQIGLANFEASLRDDASI